jgi:AmpD protein
MDLAPGYTARWHLLNGLPVPQGPPLDFVLRALAPSLGALPTDLEAHEHADAPPAPAAPAPAPAAPAPAPAAASRSYRETGYTTPNMGGAMRPQGIVLHSTYGAAAGSLAWVRNTASRVSYHTIIFPDGTRHNVVPYDRVAWHAGQSSFRGRSGCNAFMVGLAWEGNLYTRQLSEDEIASGVEICARLMRQYGFGLDWVTDHRTVSPGRKEDIPPAVLAMFKARLARAI